MEKENDFKRIFELMQRCEPLAQELKKILNDLMESNKAKIGGAK